MLSAVEAYVQTTRAIATVRIQNEEKAKILLEQIEKLILINSNKGRTHTEFFFSNDKDLTLKPICHTILTEKGYHLTEGVNCYYWRINWENALSPPPSSSQLHEKTDE
jgi:hypothetical protein